MRIKLLTLSLAFFTALPPTEPQPQGPGRIIMLVMDDVGADSMAQIPTPNFDALAAGGVKFTHAYSHPWCKPSRSSLYTGQWAGVISGDSCAPVGPTAVNANTVSFVATLREQGFLTGLIGKWHVGRAQSDTLPFWYAPHAAGFDHWWAGEAVSTIGGCNPSGTNTFDDGVFVNDGRTQTIRQRDRLFDLMDEADLQNRPLFAWVGFSDAHSPWNLPPFSILPDDYTPNLPLTDRGEFEAEIIALDFVIGQIAARMDPNDWLIIMSENGTPVEVTKPFTNRAKLTVYQRGVHVPLVIYGGGLLPGVIDDPVQLYDIPATILQGLGLEGPRGNGRNILAPAPVVPVVFVQNPVGVVNRSRAVIERRYKLIENSAGFEFYDLLLDPSELNPLPLVGPDFDRLDSFLTYLPAR